jgi:predicted membrane-bound mannosyltransferase
VAPRLRFIIPLAIVAGVGLAAAVRAWRRARKRRGRAALRSRRG